MRTLLRLGCGLLVLGFLITGPMRLTSYGDSSTGWMAGLLALSQQPVQSSPPTKAPGSQSGTKPNSPRPADTTRPTRGIVDALREQVRSSQVLEESGVQQDLMDSLDHAHDLWTRTKEQNRQALRRLQRSPRIGAARQQPHLVLITVDELGANPNAGLPALPHWSDWAAGGVTFSQHYAGGGDIESGYWSLMTGQNTGRATHPVGEPRLLRTADRETLPQLLWKAGYETALVGPWTSHVSPFDSGWDHWSGVWQPTQPVELYPQTWASGSATMRITDNADNKNAVSLWQLITADVAGLLEQNSQPARPLFLQIRLPRCQELSPAEQHAAWDTTISQIFAELSQRKLEQQTCVVLTALTGEPSSEQIPLLSEANLRVPLLIRWTGHLRDVDTSQRVTAAWDLWPTLLDLAAAKRPANWTDGRSLVPDLSGQATTKPALLYWKSGTEPVIQVVRRDAWKARYNPQNQQLQLFDLEHDPQETTNVAAAHRDIVEQLLKGPQEAVQQVLQSPTVSSQP